MHSKPSRARAVRYREEAIHSLDQDRPDEAFALLSYSFEHDPGYRSAYESAIEILETIGHYDEANLFQTALESFGEAGAFYHLGYYFFDQGQTRLAIPFLARAATLRRDHPDTLIALAISLSAEGRFREAQRTLESHPERETQFWPYYEWVYNHLLLGRPETAAKGLARIKRRLDDFRDTVSEDEIDDFDSSVDRLESGLRRHAGLPSRDDRSIRDWHYIQYGTAVLDLMDTRYGPDAAGLAGGRYLGLWSSREFVHGMLLRLLVLLSDLGFRPRRVLFGPDFESEILAQALGRLLAAPVEAFDRARRREDALVVVGSSEELSDMPDVAERAPGQALFAYALQWTRDSLVVPDVSGVLAQVHWFPWQDPHSADAELAYDLPADPRPVPEIVDWVLAAEPAPPPADWDAHREFYVRLRRELALDDWLRRPRRDRFLTNSPVRGWRFA